MNIKPIETRYGGYRFRSRLEARWAVFFDRMGLRWDYELEGWQGNGLSYLPDFWLPELSMWAEVKPQHLVASAAGCFPDPQDRLIVAKAHMLAEGSRYPVAILTGAPAYGLYFQTETPVLDMGWRGEMSPYLMVYPDYIQDAYDWSACPWCKTVSFSYHGRSDPRCTCRLDHDHQEPTIRACAEAVSVVEHAATAATFARFEHGERP